MRALTRTPHALDLDLDLTPSCGIEFVISAQIPKIFVGFIAHFAGFIERQIRIVFLYVIGGYGEKHVVDIGAEDFESLHQVICRLR